MVIFEESFEEVVLGKNQSRVLCPAIFAHIPIQANKCDNAHSTKQPVQFRSLLFSTDH